MSKNVTPNALKHGAFSEVLILPGEDVEEFEALKDALFEEYKPEGVSEERALMAIVKILWQERRLVLYQHIYRVRMGVPTEEIRDRYGIQRTLKKALGERYVPPAPEERPDKSAEERLNEQLRELGKFLTYEQLEKELEIESKLQAKIDRLFKHFFQLRAMKQIAALPESKPILSLPDASGPTLQGPVLTLTAEEAK